MFLINLQKRPRYVQNKQWEAICSKNVRLLLDQPSLPRLSTFSTKKISQHLWVILNAHDNNFVRKMKTSNVYTKR